MAKIPEWKTRKDIIDKKLKQVGWTIIPFKPGMEIPNSMVAITEFHTKSGPSDYVLFVNGNPLAIVEAKKAAREPYDSLTQGQRYSRDFPDSPFDFGEFKIPFIYSSNGNEIWFQDLRNSSSRSIKVFHFHMPESLMEMLNVDNKDAKQFLATVQNDNVFLRYYQKEAIVSIEKAFIENKRKMLLHMATGTGKTYTVVSLIYRLLKSGMFKNIVFLVDRRELARQAEDAFANFEPEIGLKFNKIYNVVNIEESAIPKNADVYICTIQRLYSILKGEEVPERPIESDDPWEWDTEDTQVTYNPAIPIETFGCIISDECHRSIYNKWKAVLDYFDGPQIGLTATPAAHTYAYFDQNMVYSYPYEKAVTDGFLVDFDVVTVKTDITMSGVKIQAGQPLILRDKETGIASTVMPEDEMQFDTTEIERKITVIDRNRQIVDEISRYIKEDEKTLVFAVDDAHADQLVKLFREKYSHLGDRIAEKITYRVDRPLEHIRAFRNRRYPMIAVTVDMLSTGVDIPAIENIIFARPVRSYVLLWQMIGRGTRRCDEIGKTHFTIFDCVGILEAFKAKIPEFGDLYTNRKAKDINEVVKQIKMKFMPKENIQTLKRKLNNISREMDPEFKTKLAEFIPEGDLKAFASDIDKRFDKDYKGTLALFENGQFMKLLLTYPRRPRYFIIDEISQDEIIASEYLFHTLDDRDLRPEDYIKTFEKFVKQNKNKIDALKILLDKPKDFKTSELKELRKKLASQPEIYTEDRLRRAYKDQLADIIAFVKHAALGEPLLHQKERIEKAFEKLYHKHEFTDAQKEWLQLVKLHMMHELRIEKEDFNDIPFSRKGGLKAAVSIFGDKLDETIKEINELVIIV